MPELNKMEEELKKRGQYWEDLPRSTVEDKKRAEEYYYQDVMPLLINVFVAREKTKVHKNYDGMILSLGTSFEPLVLSIMALNPDKVCFLFTDDSRKYLDSIIHFTGLPPRRYEMRRVDKDNPLKIYQAIKDVYQEWGQPSNIAVDFTGGTKAMSGGSAMAGGLIGADMVYIASNNYLANLRRPFPGSEHLEFIPNPYEVFGDLEEAKAFGLFAQYDYSGAYRIFDNMQNQVPDPRRYRVLTLLCRTYEAWDNLDIARARANMAELVDIVKQYGTLQKDFILFDKLSILDLQLQALNNLESKFSGFCKHLKQRSSNEPQTLIEILCEREFVIPLMFTLYCNARRREEQGKFDIASLLLYRILELMAQVRLASLGLDTIAPDYSVLSNQEEVINKINQRYKQYNINYSLNSLPDHICLFDGYSILAALEDNLALEVNLKRLRGQVTARNYNIFVHGFDFISPKKCGEFRELVDSTMVSFLTMWGENMQEIFARYKFITPI